MSDGSENQGDLHRGLKPRHLQLIALGGIIGVVLAVTVVTAGGAAFGLPVVIRPGIIILAVSFSAVVGIFFGIYPASKAAKADPIDALRYE